MIPTQQSTSKKINKNITTMKKILFAILCAGAVISCAKEEIVTADYEAISFENAFVDNATKALDNYTITKSDLGTFYVWGTTQRPGVDEIVPIFVKEAVSSTDNGATWNYAASSTQYWIPGNAYVFAAVKNYESVGLVKGVPATIVYDAATQKDLLYDGATAEGKAASHNAPVAFTFEHLLSKAYFTVKNEMSAANVLYSYRVSNIAINNAVKKATYTISTEKWADATESYTTNFGNVNGEADADTAEAVKIFAGTTNYTSHYSRLLIPAKYSTTNKLNITCTIETLYGDAVIDVNNYNKDIDFTFVKGHAYNFILTLQNPGNEIEFTVLPVNEWVTDHNGDEVSGDEDDLPTPENHIPAN